MNQEIQTDQDPKLKSLQEQRDKVILKLGEKILGKDAAGENVSETNGPSIEQLQNPYLQAQASMILSNSSNLSNSYYTDLAYTRQIIPQNESQIKRVVSPRTG